MRENHFKLPITTEGDLRAFVDLAWGVTIPDQQVCPNHTTPWRAFADSYFNRDVVTVWKASRGFGGKTFLLGLLGLTEAVTLKADVNILGGSGEQSGRVHKEMQGFWEFDRAPRYLLTSDPSRRETKLYWGNTIQALMASQASVRGPHPQRLRLDEIDEMDIKILDAAMGQPMEKGNVAKQTTMSSTHQWPDGTMTEILNRANDKGWPVYQWCYKETLVKNGGWLRGEEVVSKRREVTAAMWEAEYDLQDPAPDTRAIDPAKVKAMFKKTLGAFDGGLGESVEIEGPVSGANYSTGADWARKKDWTVIITVRMDVTPARVVAYKRMQRMPWPAMVAEFDKRVERYGGDAYHDGTGIGDVVGGYITVSADGIIMVGRQRSDMLTEYIAAIERGEIEAPYIKSMEGEHRLASTESVYMTSAHLPDSIAAGALAWLTTKYDVGVTSMKREMEKRKGG